MEKLNKREQELFEEVSRNIGKILISTMDLLNIPNFIEGRYECNGNKYKLRFEKIKEQQ